MKAVYMAIIILASAMAIGQYANADVLEDYYAQHTPEVSAEKARQSKAFTNCYPFGDEKAGYFKTEEEYLNVFDPALFTREERNIGYSPYGNY